MQKREEKKAARVDNSLFWATKIKENITFELLKFQSEKKSILFMLSSQKLGINNIIEYFKM